MSTDTFKYALYASGWAYPEIDEHCGAVVQRIVQGKQVGPAIHWPKDPDILDSPTGYDYAKKEELRVFAWDENFFYVQEDDVDGTSFIQVPRPGRYDGERIVVVDRVEDYTHWRDYERTL